MRRFFRSFAAGLIACLGRPASGAAAVPEPHIQQAAEQGPEQDWFRYDVVTGDTIEQEAQKRAEADTGSRIWKPVWVDVPPEELNAAHLAFAKWAAESDARVIRELRAGR